MELKAIITAIGIALLTQTTGCQSKKGAPADPPKTDAVFTCKAQPEVNDYKIYKLTDDGVRIGDVMTLYDEENEDFIIYFLKDVWENSINKKHPIYGMKTKNFHSYTSLSAGEIVGSSSDPCAQDFAIGTGSFIKKDGLFYSFYTGHNPHFPNPCVKSKERVMLATSTALNSKFTRSTAFTTMYAPENQGYDIKDNFRDPYVFFDDASGKYYMILSARKEVNGSWKGVIPYYTSSNLINWEYKGVLYDGGTENFFMLETPEIFKIGSTYYLVFSDIDSKHVFYRKSTSLTGPWTKPQGLDRFEGKGIYAARTVANKQGDRYILGWTYAQENNTDEGQHKWGGNLIAHKIYAKENGDLAVAIPPQVKTYLEAKTHAFNKVSERGNITNTVGGKHSYSINAQKGSLSNVVFEPLTLDQYKINTTVSYSSSDKDFGFMIGACDGFNNFYSLRFIPSQNRFSLNKVSREQINSTTIGVTDVPLQLSPNKLYDVQIVIEHSILVVYINSEVALSCRIYRASNTSWGVFADDSNATFTNITVTTP